MRGFWARIPRQHPHLDPSYIGGASGGRRSPFPPTFRQRFSQPVQLLALPPDLVQVAVDHLLPRANTPVPRSHAEGLRTHEGRSPQGKQRWFLPRVLGSELGAGNPRHPGVTRSTEEFMDIGGIEGYGPWLCGDSHDEQTTRSVLDRSSGINAYRLVRRARRRTNRAILLPS